MRNVPEAFESIGYRRCATIIDTYPSCLVGLKRMIKRYHNGIDGECEVRDVPGNAVDTELAAEAEFDRSQAVFYGSESAQDIAGKVRRCEREVDAKMIKSHIKIRRW
jgi:hypothetical protein